MDEAEAVARRLKVLRRLERSFVGVAAVPSVAATMSFTAYPIVYWVSSALVVLLIAGIAITDRAIIKRGGDSLWQGGRFVWRDKPE
ncbi:hypothetical protein [Schumannella luteola]